MPRQPLRSKGIRHERLPDLFLIKDGHMILAVGVESVSVGSRPVSSMKYLARSGTFPLPLLYTIWRSHFYNRVSRRDVLLTFFGTENFTDKVSVFDGYIQKFLFPVAR